MRALAHPVRAALLDLLIREGSLTATQASELVGESPANCSFHLRQLAKYGFVEETGQGRGRERPWRVVSIAHRWKPAPGSEAAARELMSHVVRRSLDQLWHWFATQGDEDRDWRDAAVTSDALLYLTLDEFRALKEELAALIFKYLDRTADPSKRPQGAKPVQVLSYSFPLPPTPSGN